MDLALKAWDQVSTETIRNCWDHHTEILPGKKRAMSTPETAMDDVSAALRSLQIAADDRDVVLDVPTAEEYVNHPDETDDLALGPYMSIAEICEYVTYVDDEDQDT